MKYRVKLSQIRTTEVELDAPSYDLAVLRAEEALPKAKWKLWKRDVVKIEKEPVEERPNVFGERKGDLFT